MNNVLDSTGGLKLDPGRGLRERGAHSLVSYELFISRYPTAKVPKCASGWLNILTLKGPNWLDLFIFARGRVRRKGWVVRQLGLVGIAEASMMVN